MNTFTIIILIIVGLLLVVFISGLKIIRQSTSIIVERLGKYHRTLETGVHFVLPFIERSTAPISRKERVADFKPQPVITKDNVTMNIDTVVYFQITDAKLFNYGVDKPISAIENLTSTTLRNIIGSMDLDQTFTSRDTVNSKMCMILDDATDAWGVKINRVELKNIMLPREMQDAMEKQSRAERERRESILRAEGEKHSNILIAEGEKEAAVLRAEAKKIALITEAEGQAQSIKLICDAKPSIEYITLQGYEALTKLGQGDANKIIVPTDISNVSGLLTSLSEVVKPIKPNTKKPTKAPTNNKK